VNRGTDHTTRTLNASLTRCAPAEPLGGVRKLQVLNPTMTTLNVRWEPAEGRVKEYKVLHAPAAGGAQSMVGLVGPLPAARRRRPAAFRWSSNCCEHQC